MTSVFRRGIAPKAQEIRGFTLVELMIVVVILAVLMTVAAPSFRSFILEQRARATLADLRIALMTARSEAVKRNRDVAVIPATGGWKNGWRIASPESGDHDLLNHAQSGSSDVAITLTTGSTVGFEANGRAEEAVKFTVNVGSGAYTATKCLRLNAAGYMDNDCS